MTLRGTAPTAAAPIVEKRWPGVRALAMAVVAGLSTFDPTAALAVGPWVAIAVLVLGRPLRFQVNAPVLFAVLFALWAGMSQVWTASLDFTHATAVLWVQVLVMFIAAHDLIKSRAQLRVVATGFVTGAVFTVVKHVYFAPEVAESMATGGGRAILGNANVNYVAYALTTALSLVVLLWVSRTRTKLSLLVLGGAATMLVIGLIVSDTRAAQLGGALLVAWLMLCAITRRRPLKLVVAAVLASAFCILTGVTDQASLAFESGARVTGDWSGRLTIWPLAREMWAENPILGVGAGGFIVTSGLGVGAHNVILQTGTGLGLVGVALLVGLIWSALAGTRQPLLIGAFLSASAPMYLSGMWETAPAAWIAIAIFSRARVFSRDEPRRELRAPAANRPAVPDWAKTRSGQNLIGPNANRPLISRRHA